MASALGVAWGLRGVARVWYRSFAVYLIGRIAWSRAPDPFSEGRWPEVLVVGYALGRFFTEVLGLLFQ
jgi:hypothetical protein